MASGGTFFLDEVSNMPLGSQAKLLRVLQERTICRIGGTQHIPVDVRILAASNQDLHRAAESKQGLFRRDVYFRLNEYTIKLPPLRERREDIPYLAQRFLNLTNAELHKKVENFTQGAADALLAYHWPGNVRELRSMIRRAVLLADDTIDEHHLAIPTAPPQVAAISEDDAGYAAAGQKPWNGLSLKDIVQPRIAALEREILLRVMRETGGNKARASRLLHIDYKTIHLKLKEYGIPAERTRKGEF